MIPLPLTVFFRGFPFLKRGYLELSSRRSAAHTGMLLPDIVPADLAVLHVAEVPDPALALAQLEHSIEVKVGSKIHA